MSHTITQVPVNHGLTFFSNGIMKRDGCFYPGHPHGVDGGAGALLGDGRQVIDAISFEAFN